MTDQAEKQPFWELIGLPAPGTPMRAESFDALAEVNIPIELIHGIVVYPHWNEDTMTAAPIPDHQDVVGNVYTLLREAAKQQGGKAAISPLDIRLSDGSRVQPDAMWMAASSQCIRMETHYRNLPELVVEVLSPSTARRDRTEKFDLYEKHGAHEYWMIDPRDALIEVYVRDLQVLQRLGAYGPTDTFQSPTLGMTSIIVRELFLI
ncbi:MAG: Uma2 family endonuclease [Phototrophicaceae bacterium]|jgi:Uma2 family endonuclease